MTDKEFQSCFWCWDCSDDAPKKCELWGTSGIANEAEGHSKNNGVLRFLMPGHRDQFGRLLVANIAQTAALWRNMEALINLRILCFPIFCDVAVNEN